MSARSLVLAACAALAMLTATAPKAMAQYYPQDDWRARHWEHEMRERARWEAEARERAWREREWRERQPVYVPVPLPVPLPMPQPYYQPGW
ncbi:MAG: hypothetical protein P4L66_07070 [Acetobacteraceae bacterium]|nr:hypothetical protein [Acetobacteraceae bacterium]